MAKSHIIPAAFFRAALGEDDHLLMVTDNPTNPHAKRLRNGVYDETILCHACERLFDKVDDYASKILIQADISTFKPLINNGHTIGYQRDGLDQETLLRFLVATLWRASVSTQQFYRRVSLGGEFESEAAKCIHSPMEPISESFAATLSIWVSSKEGPGIVKPLMDPFPERYIGIKGYRIYFGRFVAYVKVDRRPFVSPLAEASLCVSPTMTVIARDLNSSKDLQTLKMLTLRSHENRERWRQ